mgnify:CR=1 FL=1
MFGERLKSILQDSDISQLKLAQELGYTQQAVNRWCNNITEPDNKTIVDIAKYLNVSTDYLLGNDATLNKNEEELREIDTLKRLLIKNGYMNQNDDLTKKELNNLIKMIKNNKEFIKGMK